MLLAGVAHGGIGSACALPTATVAVGSWRVTRTEGRRKMLDKTHNTVVGGERFAKLMRDGKKKMRQRADDAPPDKGRTPVPRRDDTRER